ncbi:uncharacterized protein [Medicago truncatula]|uniref:Transmembrane protein, putative n=1 Tax=Medicago truncatula TaxID=3880 RepID=A0A072UDQ8_MEDTR|nr:uncharacterized protein LOC11415684 isoform X1 [Medicago truncatula]KEH27757.1 transmembrane protein, putative [Medicago truncatula]
MASNCSRKCFQIASSSSKTLLSRRSSSSSNSCKFNSSASSSSSSFQASPQKRLLSYSIRFPVQLAGTQVSLTPLHSVTASALFTSLLSLHNNTWGVLSEGFATPL